MRESLEDAQAASRPYSMFRETSFIWVWGSGLCFWKYLKTHALFSVTWHPKKLMQANSSLIQPSWTSQQIPVLITQDSAEAVRDLPQSIIQTSWAWLLCLAFLLCWAFWLAVGLQLSLVPMYGIRFSPQTSFWFSLWKHSQNMFPDSLHVFHVFSLPGASVILTGQQGK